MPKNTAPSSRPFTPGQESVDVEAKITYEDGRTTTMKANLKVRDVETLLMESDVP